MGLFDSGGDFVQDIAPAAGYGVGTFAGPMAGTLTSGALGGTSGGLPGMIGGVSDRLAGMDPTRSYTSDFKAQPISSDFQATNPLPPGFADALSASQGNANMAFAPGAGGAPSFAQGLMGNYNQAQNQQQALMGNLQQQSMGNGMGNQLSHNYLNQAMNQNAANAMGLAASQKGINPAMAARMAGQNASSMNAQAAGQTANLNLQQALAAQQQYGNMLGQNQALNANTFGNVSGMANQQYGNLMNTGVNANLGMQGLNQQTQAQNAANAMGAQGINANTANANIASKQKTGGGIMGGLGSLGAAAIMMSDGGRVPGASDYNGDDVKNDTVPTMLSPGEIVIPRSSSGDREKAIRFLDALKSTDGSWKKKSKKGEK